MGSIVCFGVVILVLNVVGTGLVVVSVDVVVGVVVGTSVVVVVACVVVIVVLVVGIDFGDVVTELDVGDLVVLLTMVIGMTTGVFCFCSSLI